MVGMHQYFLIYKPFQVLSQFGAQDGKPGLAAHFSLPKDVYPVGRLDYDSEGLLLLTNNRKVNAALLHPLRQHKRCYYAQVEGLVEQAALLQLEKGVQISVDGRPYTTLPAMASSLQPAPTLPLRHPPIRVRLTVPDCWISLTLTEGKNRQVRKMTAAVGHPTLRLVRYSIESLTIEGMQPGDIVSIPEKTFFRKLNLPPLR